jgi:RNA polymerase sigma-70 factor (ECF subfamily)
LDENKIIESCKLGDKEAFEVLYEDNITKALQTSYLIVNNKSLAEDIVQEAFIECYRDIKCLKHPEAFTSWFYKILLRISWRMAKRERKHRTEEVNVDSLKIIEAEHNSTVFESSDLDNVVQKSIGKLNAKLRNIVILYYYNDMSVKEIAKVIGCFEGTVKSRLFTARKVLKKELEASGVMFELNDNYYIDKECETNG